MKKLEINCVFLFLSLVSAGLDTGNPAGFMADCPGMNSSTRFSEKTRRSLTAVVIRPGSEIFGRETTCRLSVAGAACTAKHLNLKERTTEVIISGYLDSSFSPLVRSMASTYVSRGYNVIIVEIFPVLVRPYPIAARVTRPLGEVLGKYLSELTRLGLPPNNLELMGGSLGAHIASYGAQKYKDITGYKPKRLTGLDPAGPCFRNLPPSERLHADVAERVDAVHTNIDGFGLADPVGHIDFYVNGGEYQPALVKGYIAPCFLLCSHVRSAYYWISAVANPTQFIAVRCDSVAHARTADCYRNTTDTNLMGLYTNFNKPGIYYLPTEPTTPYYIGQKALHQRKYGLTNYLTKVTREGDLIL